VKFTDRGEIAVQVSVNRLGETDATLQFSVSDSGIGIPKDKQNLVFEPFIQADDRRPVSMAARVWGWRSAITL